MAKHGYKNHKPAELDNMPNGGGWIKNPPASLNGKSQGTSDPNGDTALTKAWCKPTFDGWYDPEEQAESPAVEVEEQMSGQEK